MVDVAEERRGSYPALRLSWYLRYMRGTPVASIAAGTNGGQSTVYAVIGEVRNAILEEKELEYEFNWGSTSWLGYVAETFKLKFATRLFGRCVGALDGISIRIQKPGQLANCAAYYCGRKCFYR